LLAFFLLKEAHSLPSPNLHMETSKHNAVGHKQNDFRKFFKVDEISFE
jgi:hypothetical protein